MNDKNPHELWSRVHWLGVLAQQGSYTAAAARLGVSKAAMSQHMAELERMAGSSLVRRTTRSVQLTEVGQRLVERTRTPFQQIADSFAEVRDLSGAPRGRLRVTAPVALARQQLVPRLPDFLRAYPEVLLELDMSDRLVSMTAEGFDLAIRHTMAAPDTHVAWELCATRSVLVASRAYLRRAGTPAKPQDLVAHNCLHYPRPQEAPAWTFEASGARAAGGRVTIPVVGTLSANNSEALREAALAGVGIALLPDFSAQASLQAGKLVQVLPRWKPVGAFAEHIYAIRPYAQHVPRAATVFVAFLRQALSKGFAKGP